VHEEASDYLFGLALVDFHGNCSIRPMAPFASAIRYLEQGRFMPPCQTWYDLEKRWHAAVGAYALAAQDLLKARPGRTIETNRTYETARLEFEESKRLLDEHQNEHRCHMGSKRIPHSGVSKDMPKP